MMQKIVDFERAAAFSSSTLIAAPSSTMITSLPLPTPASSSATSSETASSTESSALNSPLSPTSVEEEILLRASTSGGGGVGVAVGSAGIGISTRSGSPYPFPAIMAVSPDPKTPAQFLMGLGIQILEGRLPHHKQAKGFLEGDHCTSLFKSVSHFCDFETNPLCRQLASLQFLLLSDPSNFTLEVSLTPKHGTSNNTTNEYNTSTSSTIANNYVQHEMLIEKWRVTLLPQEESEAGLGSESSSGRVGGAPPVMMTPRNLHNAVRSFLHFSQLAAWLSKKKEFTSAWKVRIDIGDSGQQQQQQHANGNGVKDGWDRHEFPAVTLESPSFSDAVAQTHHQNNSPSPTQRGWGKGRSNSKWIVKVTVDSLPRMENFPPLPVPVPSSHRSHYHHSSTTSTNNSINTNTNNPTINKPCLSSSTSSSSSASTSSGSLAISSHSTAMVHNKSQQQQMMLHGGISGMMMLGENGENVSGVRIRFRGGRSRRSHASGGNNGSSSHRSRPKNLRIAIPDASQTFEEDADIGSFDISSNGTLSSESETATPSSSTATSTAVVVSHAGAKNRFPLLAGEVHPHYIHSGRIPSLREKLLFDSSLNRTTTSVFHKSGLPLTSSPAPIRRTGVVANDNDKYRRFDFDSSLLPKCSRGRALGCPHFHGQKLSEPSQSLLGSFEESVLNGRIEPVSTVEGFTAEVDVGSSHNFKLPVTVFFYTFCDNDRVSSPYSAHVTLSPTVYPVPRRGTLQVTLYNPMKTVVKMFVINYDLSRMPADSQTFIRQKILFMPLGKTDRDPGARKWLRYLIHLRFGSSPSGDKIYLHKDIRMIVLNKSDADTAVGLSSVTGGSGGFGGACQDKESDTSAPYELRSFTYFADVPPPPPYKQAV